MVARMAAHLAACLAALLAALPPAAEATRLHSRRKTAAATLLLEEPEPPADSKTIDGPDCGNVKQVISHWAKAKKVGKVAGSAKGAVMHAEHVGDLVEKALEKAKDIGTKASGGTEPSEAVAKAVGEAETAAGDLTGASTDLSSELDAYNAKRSSAEWPEGVPEEDTLKLKKLTAKTNDAAKMVQDLTVNALERAKKAEAAAEKQKSEAALEVKAFYDKGQGRLKESKDVYQKAGWLRDDADSKAKKATETAADLAVDDKVKEEALGTDGDQKPVLEALAEKLTTMATGVTEADTELETAMKDLEAAQGELEGLLTPMKQVVDAVATGDSSGLAAQEEQVVPAEGTLTKFDLVVQTVESKMETLEGRVDKLDKVEKEAGTKLK